MGNYIKSELFRLRKSKVLWGLMAITVFYIIAMICSFGEGKVLSIFGDCMIVPYALTVIIGLVVVADGYKNKTLNNEFAYGISENKIYFSKIIVSIIVGVLFFIVVDVITIPATCLVNGKENINYISGFLMVEGIIFIACIASVVLFMTLFFIIKNSIVSAIIWYILALKLDAILLVFMVGFWEIYDMICKFLLASTVKNVYIFTEPVNALNAIISSVIVIVVCIICKLVIKKKEQ